MKDAVDLALERAGVKTRRGVAINVDFDGTVVTHEFPEVGKDVGAVPVLRELVAEGHRLILFTMRSDGSGGRFLQDAIDWFEARDIPLYGVQEHPEQRSWTSSPKSYAQVMIDDSALGVPLTMNPQLSRRPFVDWAKVRRLLVQRGLLRDVETGEVDP